MKSPSRFVYNIYRRSFLAASLFIIFISDLSTLYIKAVQPILEVSINFACKSACGPRISIFNVIMIEKIKKKIF